MNPKIVSQIRERLCRAANSWEIHEQLGRVINNSDFSATTQITLALDGFAAAQRLTEEDVEAARPLLLDYLLPLVIKSGVETREGQIAQIHAREILTNWIYQYKENVVSSLLSQVSARLIDALETDEVKGACVTLAEIGYRNAGIIDALESLVGRSVDLNDLALDTIAALGAPSLERYRLLTLIHENLREKPRSSLLWTLRRIPDPRSLPVLREIWPALRHSPDASDIFWLLGAIAGTTDDSSISDEIAELIRKFSEEDRDHSYQPLAFGSDILPRCNSAGAVTFFLRTLEGDEDTGPNFGRWYSVLYRLRECFRPRQLEGFAYAHEERMVETIRRLLFTKDGDFGDGMPAVGEMKPKALDLAFRIGASKAIDWCEEFLAIELNPYIKNEMLELWSCFRLTSFPKTLTALLTEKRDFKRGSDNAELLICLATTRLMRSQASEEAFVALLNVGFTLEGYTLQDTSEALAEVAVRLAQRQGPNVILFRLWNVFETATGGPAVTAAARSIVAFAESALLSSDDQERIVMLIRNSQNLDSYARSLLHQALGYLSPSGPATLELLHTGTRDSNKWVSARSLEALARLGVLADHKEILIDHLGLFREEKEGVWRWRSKKAASEWAPLILATLYSQQPIQFTSTMEDLVENAGWLEASQALRLIASYNIELPRTIVDKLRIRIHKNQSPTTAELGLFTMLVKIAPQLLVAEWSENWRDWMPEVRIELADSLAELKQTLFAAEAAIQLAYLAKDSFFGVRRAALRGLSQVRPELLKQKIQLWTESPFVEERCRAGEAVGWLPSGETASDLLLGDEHRKVRNAARVAIAERQRRIWASIYLGRLINLGGENSELLAFWNCARALVELGDDQTIRLLSRDIIGAKGATNLNWFKIQIGRGIEKQWENVRKKWPEPVSDREGSVEGGIGWLEWAENRRKVKYLVIRPLPEGIDSTFRWRGDAATISGEELISAFGHTARLEFQDGRRAEVQIVAYTGDLVEFIGSGTFPS